jgi:hypothetical protein
MPLAIVFSTYCTLANKAAIIATRSDDAILLIIWFLLSLLTCFLLIICMDALAPTWQIKTLPFNMTLYSLFF